jgi:hypothetical protein
MSLTRDLPIRSVGFPPTNAVHPPAPQHGVFIPIRSIQISICENRKGFVISAISAANDLKEVRDRKTHSPSHRGDRSPEFSGQTSSIISRL